MIILRNAYTGETPAAWLGTDFGGRDDYRLRDWSFTSNLDSPELMPAGSTINNNHDEVPVSRYISRP